MRMETELTEKQKRVFEFIRKRIAQSLPPTIREIAKELGFSSTGTVRDYLRTLEKKGYLKREGNLSRAIELAKGGFPGIPIIASIPAGRPDLAYEDIQGYVNADDLYLGRLAQDDVFALKVKGDSMVEAGIMDGDIAVIKKQKTAENRQIIAALLENNEVTLKRLRKTDSFYLEPANKKYQAIKDEFTVIGRLLTIIRKY